MMVHNWLAGMLDVGAGTCGVRRRSHADSVFVVTCLCCFAGAGGAEMISFAPTTKTVIPVHFPSPPDTRPPGCEAQVIDPEGRNFSDLRVSIVIPYRQEKWKHILGSVESILWYTPKRLIADIIFVSDGNGPETIYLDELRKFSPLISVLVLPSKGVGLISAKMRGVGATDPRSKVILFLEPHVRVNRAWLEPLLLRIRKHPRALVMPVIDTIPQDDFDKYHPAEPGHWRFEWNFNLIYTNPSGMKSWPTHPVLSPATSGGIFAIRKDFWNELELYDTGMVGWGGDHIEATFKVWRCGGHIEMVPCSRIGHLFRNAEHRPYDTVMEQLVKNYARIAETWLDGDYLSAFHKVKPETIGMKVGNITRPRSSRDKLQCRDMKWYLENVDREMLWEFDHICVPGCIKEGKERSKRCCIDAAAPGRSTIDRIIPHELYNPLLDPDSFKAASEASTSSRVTEEL